MMLAQAGVFAVLGLAAAYGVLLLFGWFLASVLGWISGGREATEPAAPPQPQPEGHQPPRWMSELGHGDLWSGLAGNLARWVEHQAAVTGIPGAVLLSAWATVGAGLLLVAVLHAWFNTHNRLLTAVGWWAWLAATVWLLHALTPGGNVVPAALAGAVGVALSLGPLTTLVGASVVFGLAASGIGT